MLKNRPVTQSRVDSIISSDNDIEALKENPMLSYLGARQKSKIPFLPIRGVNERQLIHRKVVELVQTKQ